MYRLKCITFEVNDTRILGTSTCQFTDSCVHMIVIMLLRVLEWPRSAKYCGERCIYERTVTVYQTLASRRILGMDASRLYI